MKRKKKKEKWRSLYFKNRKEYYRRKKISESMKKYWKRRKEREKAEREKKRLRQQICYNSDYNISFRAIIINSKLNKTETEQLLKSAIWEFLLSNSPLLRLPFVEGREYEYIDETEDFDLEDNQVYIETNIRGDYELIKWD